jgi:hypothetical protein
VLAILPEESRRKAEQTRMFAPDFLQSHSRSDFDMIHQAISAQQVLALHYRMKPDRCPSATFCRWGCSSGESAGCWPGVSCAMIIAVSGSTAVSILCRRRGDLASGPVLADFLRKVKQ